MDKECVWVTAFAHMSGPNNDFERVHIQHIWKTEKEALEHISFCDEAGWYNTVIIEPWALGWEHLFRSERTRHWFVQQEDGSLKKIEEPKEFNCIMRMTA